MSKNSEELDRLVLKYFGIEVAEWGEQEDFDATNMTTISEDGIKTVANKGRFEVYNFTASDGNWYKLADWDYEYQEDEELVAWMKDAEHAAVKDYEQINPKSPISKYSLYRLIPYTVQGEPQW